MYKDCNLCPHISVTEEEQCGTKEDHICNKYGKRVFHMSTGMLRWHDPRLEPCKQCVDDNEIMATEVVSVTESRGSTEIPEEILCEYTMKEEV